MNYKSKEQKNGYIKKENGNDVVLTLNKDGDPKAPEEVFTFKKNRPEFLKHCTYHYDENGKLEFFKEVTKNEHWEKEDTETYYKDMKTLAPHVTTEKIKDGNVINSLEIEQDRDSLKKRETKKTIIDDKIKDFYEGNFCHYEDGTLKVAIEV
jgi:hypothetical protein